MLDLKIPWGKKKLERSKEPQFIPKWTPRSEIVDLDCWIKSCAEYKDLFEGPGTPVKRDIKHQIDLLNPDAPVKSYK